MSYSKNGFLQTGVATAVTQVAPGSTRQLDINDSCDSLVDWQTPFQGTWAATGGVFRQSSTTASSTKMRIATKGIGNESERFYRADIRFPSSGQSTGNIFAGLLFGPVGDTTGNLLGRVQRVAGNWSLQLEQESVTAITAGPNITALSLDTFYTLGLRKSGTNYTLTLTAQNSTAVLATITGSYTGTDGQYPTLYTNGAVVDFDNILYARAIDNLVTGTAVVVTSTATSLYGSPSINMPQGTQQRQYTFDNDTQGFTTDSGSLSQSNGRLQVASPGAANASILEPATVANIADGEVYVDLYPITPDNTNQYDMGVVIRATDANNHYLIAVRQGSASSPVSQFQIFKKVSGTYTSLNTTVTTTTLNTPVNMAPNAIGRVMVRFVAAQISVYYNEEYVISAVDSTFNTGRVGMRLAGASANTTQFDNLTVLSLPSTWTPFNYTPQSAAAAPQYQIPTAAQINYSEVTITGTKTITNQAWSVIPLDTIVSDPNSLFSTTTGFYTVPVTGTYAVGLTFRSDAIAGSNVGLAIHTSNTDSTNTVWRQDSAGTGNRHTFQYYKVAKFNAGDQLRAIAYVDVAGSTLISGATATFQQVSTSAATPAAFINPENVTTANVSGTYTMPETGFSPINRLTLTGNTVFTFPTVAAGKSFTVVLVQDATGGRTVTWPGNVMWPNSTTPFVTATANKRDVFTFFSVDGVVWLGSVAGQNY